MDFGVIDVVLTRDGRKKYIPDDWQERLHSHAVGETAAQRAAGEDAERLLAFIDTAREEGLNAALKIGYRLWTGRLGPAVALADDASADAGDRACAGALLLEYGGLEGEAVIARCMDILSLMGEQPSKTSEIFRLLQYHSPQEDGFSYGDACFNTVVQTVLDSEGPEALLNCLPDKQTLDADDPAQGSYDMVNEVAAKISYGIENYDIHAVLMRCAQKGYYSSKLLSAYQKVNGAADTLERIRELMALPSCGFGDSSDYSAFIGELNGNDGGLDGVLGALKQINALLPDAISDEYFTVNRIGVPSA